MKTFAPQYYTRFKCRADKCKHTCCAGWEIDVDGVTLNKYESVGGEMGERIKKSLTQGDGALCFALKEDKCPFLNDSGLCDIITVLGEDYLSQVCADHPRFRNFLFNRTEVGVGLTCEEACSLVLNSDDNFLIEIDDDGVKDKENKREKRLLKKRNELLDIANGRGGFAEKCCAILDSVQAKLIDVSTETLRETYLLLERMDESWADVVAEIEQKGQIRDEKKYSRILAYMLYRHVLDALDESSLRARTAFCVHATYFVSAVADVLESKGVKNADEEAARTYSSEIEYSEENLHALINFFDTRNENGA